MIILSKKLEICFLFIIRWYFKSIRRIDAEKQLMSDVNDHGSFLIRDSETRRTDFSLSSNLNNYFWFKFYYFSF
jgi:hypothetical protein